MKSRTSRVQPQTPLNHYPPPSQESKERSMDGSDCGQEVREENRGRRLGGGEGRGIGLDGMVFADRE
jgi:hypothetical protein